MCAGNLSAGMDVLQEYRAPEGRITLFLGNKSTSTLEHVNMQVAPTANYRVAIQAPPPQVLPPKTQQQVVVMVGQSAPALNPPTLNLSYTLGTQKVRHLPPGVSCLPAMGGMTTVARHLRTPEPERGHAYATSG